MLRIIESFKLKRSASSYFAHPVYEKVLLLKTNEIAPEYLRFS